MSGRIVPRGAVLTLAVLIIGAPAALSLAEEYWEKAPSGEVIHTHTSQYDVFNDISNDAGLRDRANESRVEWSQDLTAGTSLKMPSVTSSTGAEIRLRRAPLQDSNAASAWTSPETAFHRPALTVATFNADLTNSWSAVEKRGRACHALGRIIGLANAGSARDDCLESPSVYDHVNSVSIGKVDEYYGPRLSLSGSMRDQASNLRGSRSYTLAASAEGHALAKTEIFIDGASTPAATSPTTTSCPDSCTRTATLTREGVELGDGAHTLRIVATNEFDQTVTRTLDVYVEVDTGMLDHYTFETQALRDRSDLSVNVASGNMVLEERDIQLAGTGLDLVLARHYNSQSNRETGFGRGWSMSTGEGVYLKPLTGGEVRFFGPTGYAVRYKNPTTSSGTTTYDAPNGLDASLKKLGDGTYELRWLASEERMVFDAQGRLTEHRDRDGHKIQFSYDGSSQRLTAITDTLGRHLDVTYWGAEDPARSGLIKQIAERSGDTHFGTSPRTWRYEYDANRNLTAYYDPAHTASDPAVTYEYPGGRMGEIQDPLNTETAIGYEQGRVSGVTRDAPPDGVGYKTSFAYETGDSRCEGEQESTRVQDPIGTASGDPQNHETIYCSDGRSRVKKIFDARGNRQELGYSTLSNVQTYATQSGQEYTLNYNSNAAGFERVGSITAPGNTKTQLAYSDNTFRPSSVTDPQGHELAYSYSASGSLTEIKKANDPSKIYVELNYRTEGETTNPLKVGTLEWSEDGENHRTSYEVDDKGRLITETPPGTGLQGPTQYTYDERSRLRTVETGRAIKRQITYDPLDRTTQVDYGDFQADLNTPRIEDSACYGYDLNGNLTSRTDPCDRQGRSGNRDEFRFDARNQRYLDILRGERSVEYTYDAAGNLDTLGYRNGAQSLGLTHYDYNEVNLVSAIDEPDVAADFSFTYDADNRLKELGYPNGVTQSYTYENEATPRQPEHSGRLEQIKATNGAGTVLAELKYDYTNSTTGAETAQITQIRDLARNRKTGLGYDFLNRLTSAKIRNDSSGALIDEYSYAWSDASNRTSETFNGTQTTYQHNAANELTQVGQSSLAYDDNGNTTTSQAGHTLSYNNRDQTDSIDPAGGDPFALDYAGETQAERLSKGQITYTENLLGLGAQNEPGAASPTWFTRNPDTGQALSMLRPEAGGDRYFLTDHIGSVIGLTDQTGSLARSYAYEPFGQQASSSTGSGPESPIRFQNQYLDSETGLYKIGVRYYDPEIGRWTQKDPLNLFQDPRQGNRYLYAGADPVNMVDPGGMSFGDYAESCGLSSGTAAGAAAFTGGGAVPAAIGGCFQGLGVQACHDIVDTQICDVADFAGYARDGVTVFTDVVDESINSVVDDVVGLLD
jgi:RHS repeat-associated protein